MSKMNGANATRRVGVVEDEPLIIEGLMSLVRAESGFMIAAAAPTVGELIATTTDLDLVILDLLLPDGSSPFDNVLALQAAGCAVMIYTSGDRPDLIRLAAAAGVLGGVRKSEKAAVIHDAIRTAVNGDVVGSMDWAAAIDADPAFTSKVTPRLTPAERDVLALYAAGETAGGVAELMRIQPGTVYKHLARIRDGYADVGRPVPDRSTLRRAAVADGIAPRAWWRGDRR